MGYIVTERATGGINVSGGDINIASGMHYMINEVNLDYTHVEAAPITHVGAGGTTAHANVVAAGAAGFMTGADKTKLDNVVTSVTGTSPVVSSGGATPAISMPAATNANPGYATAAHITALEADNAKVTNATHTGDVTGATALTIANKVTMTATSPVAVSGSPTVIATGAVAISMPAATNANPGYATAAHIAALEADNAKVTNATHTGDVTGATALTIANKVTMTATSPVVVSGSPTVIAAGAVAISMPAATASVNGYATAAQITKLDGIATGAQPGTVTSITAGNGLTGGTITTSGTIAVSFYASNPVMDGMPSPGSNNNPSRGDHRHPSDTSRAASVHQHSASDITSGGYSGTFSSGTVTVSHGIITGVS
jgi:hypothetical protein